MELYKIGSILLDISIGLLVVGALVRLFLTLAYSRHNKNTSPKDASDVKGRLRLSDEQRKTIRRTILPISFTGLIFAIAALVLLLLS